MKQTLTDACELLREAFESKDNAERIEAYAIRKGRTLFVVSDEAQNLRRLDAVYGKVES